MGGYECAVHGYVTCLSLIDLKQQTINVALRSLGEHYEAAFSWLNAVVTSRFFMF